MKDTAKRVGYLKGLLEGMNFETDSANGKIIHCIAELLSDLTDRVDTMDEVLADLNDYVESIDDDLSALEDGSDEDAYNFLDDDDEAEDYDDFEDGEDQLHLLHSHSSAEPASKEETLAGALCPECSRMFFVSTDDPEGAAYVCPHCSATITPVPLTPDNAPIVHPVNDAD